MYQISGLYCNLLENCRKEVYLNYKIKNFSLKLVFVVFVILIFSGCNAPTAPELSIEWEKTFGGTEADRGYSVCKTSDGGYMIAGETCSFGANVWDVYLIKTDSSGDTLWTENYGTPYPVYDEAFSVQQTIDEGYIVAGGSSTWGYYQVYLLKIDTIGNVL